MIQDRLNISQFGQSNNQADYLKSLRRNINILFYDHILPIDSLGAKTADGVLISPDGDKIRVSNATFSQLSNWLEKGVAILRSTKQRKPFDNGQADMLIELYDSGKIYS